MTKIKLIVKSLLPVAVALLTLGSCAKTSDVDNLKTQVTTLENDLKAAIQTTEGELARLNQAVAAAATQTEVNAIKESIKTIEEKLKALNDLSAQVEELKGKAGDNASAIASIQQKLDKIVGRVSITVSAPGFAEKELVNIKFAKWNPDENDAFKTIVKTFPEVQYNEKGKSVYQKGYANVIVNPGEVDFTQYNYCFVDVEGNSVEFLYGPAEKGFSTKSAAGFWKLGVNLCVGSEKKFIEEKGPFSLEVNPGEEVTAHTEFKYYVQAKDCSDADVKVSAQNANDSAIAFYAPSINVFEPASEILGLGAIATVENVYESYYVVALAEDDSTKSVAEKYDITCEGDCIKVGKDVEKATVGININVTALGMNGSAVTKTINVTIGKPIAGKMKDLDFAYDFAIDPLDFRWKIADMELTDVQLEYLAGCDWTCLFGNPNFHCPQQAVKFYDGDDKEVSSPEDAVYFGFTAVPEIGPFVTGHRNEINLYVTDPEGAVVYADLAYAIIRTKAARTWVFLDADYSVWDIKFFNQGMFALSYDKWVFQGSTDQVEEFSEPGVFFDKDMEVTTEKEKIAYVGASIDAGVSGEYPVNIYTTYSDKVKGEVVNAYFSSSVVMVDSIAAPDFKAVDTVGTMAFYWTKEQAAELFGKCIDSEFWYYRLALPEDAFVEEQFGTLLLFDEKFEKTTDRKVAAYVGFMIGGDLLASGNYSCVIYAQSKFVVDKAFGVRFYLGVDGGPTIEPIIPPRPQR